MTDKRRMTQKEFIEQAVEANDDRYDYTNTVFIDTRSEVDIYCPIHKKNFKKEARIHLLGRGCLDCKEDERLAELEKKRVEFINEANALYGGKYDYSRMKFAGVKYSVDIYCPLHDRIFTVLPYKHINNKDSCSKCVQQIRFIEDSNKAHNNFYDYSKVKYQDAQTRVEIICPIHNHNFWQRPVVHRAGEGWCDKCIADKDEAAAEKSKIQFLKDAKEIHGDDYDYSETIFGHGELKIRCKKHDKYFSLWMYEHIGQKQGCRLCFFDRQKKSQEDFVKESTEIHGNKHNYSKSIYNGYPNEVEVFCNYHKKNFTTTPMRHIGQKQGCPSCFQEFRIPKGAEADVEFKRRSIEVHGDKYDYSKSVYLGSEVKLEITCKVPGHNSFWQEPLDHINAGSGCKLCAIEDRKLTREEFIERSIKLNGNKYDYSLVVYKWQMEPVIIICNKHKKEFTATPHAHMAGGGHCKLCANSGSIDEERIKNWLESKSIQYDKIIIEANNRIYKPDFYIPSINLIIEYNGAQHYGIVNFTGDIYDVSVEKFKKQIQRDNELRHICKDRGFHLLEIDGRVYNKKKLAEWLDTILDKDGNFMNYGNVYR